MGLKFLDLFAGIGGFKLGMELAGHESVGYCEIDKFARKSYEAIFDTEGEWTAHDITEVSDDDIRFLAGRGIQCICAGFPCQTFSVAGKRGGFSDTRGTLFFQIARIAKQIKPRFLFLENVKGLLSHEKGKTFATILNTLDELGYDAEWQVLNSKDFGVPQNRERVFIVGHLRGSSFGKIFPIETANRATDLPVKIVAHRKGYRRNTQVFDPVGITEALDTGTGRGRGHYTFEHDGSVQPVLTPEIEKKSQNGRRIKDDGEPMFTLTVKDRHGIMLTRNQITKLTDVPHAIMARDYKRLGNQEMAGVLEQVKIKEATKKGYDEAKPGDSVNYSLPNSKTRRGRVGKGVANTLETNCRQGVLTDEFRIRKLTPLECWRLQGFPDWAFHEAEKVNSNSQLYKQAGNSVTVNVIYEIARRLETVN